MTTPMTSTPFPSFASNWSNGVKLNINAGMAYGRTKPGNMRMRPSVNSPFLFVHKLIHTLVSKRKVKITNTVSWRTWHICDEARNMPRWSPSPPGSTTPTPEKNSKKFKTKPKLNPKYTQNIHRQHDMNSWHCGHLVRRTWNSIVRARRRVERCMPAACQRCA